jgi:Holliday junction resolvasome RuvABC ATP-dependent DNA helicase subunit
MKYYQTTTYINNMSVTNAEVNVNDSKFINLSMKSQVKPASVQYRILRRILEKRQAQAKHRMNKVIVPKDLEPLNWEKDLDDYQKVYNFAS